MSLNEQTVLKNAEAWLYRRFAQITLATGVNIKLSDTSAISYLFQDNNDERILAISVASYLQEKEAKNEKNIKRSTVTIPADGPPF